MTRSAPLARHLARVALMLTSTLAGCSPATPQAPSPAAPAHVSLDQLAIEVTAAENRPVAFTNKRSAYYYTQTHGNDHPEHAWFRGFNLAGRRVFNDYHLLVDGKALDPATARVVVRPDALIRTYPGGLAETLRLFDDRDVVEIAIGGAGVATSAARAAAPAAPDLQLRLSGDQLKPAGSVNGLSHYVSSTGGDAPVVDHVVVGRSGDRFFIAVAPSTDKAAALFREAADNATRWEELRRLRMEGLINGERRLWTDDAALTEALRWLTLTTDELVTRQRGDGIYAGLPWFPEYWGRDSFISLAGATLVTGHFEAARAILASFARFQDLDRASPFYGRLPNIVKPGSIDYHTTDGTPRWVIALRDYVAYSGDRSLARELYPNVAASIEGSFAHWTDSLGYLTHADNETWMDARREPDKVPYSPRGNRANDIQALWYGQLTAGAELARLAGDPASAARWATSAARLRGRFARDYVDAAGARVADRLDARGIADWTLRPNLLFALDLMGDDALAARATRRAWEALVYPWGVATLEPGDPRFRPYHLDPRWHKDEAYHNGTVWPWLNGIAMQRAIEQGQTELAWRLFRWTAGLALRRGVVGGLPETMDAWPHPGEAEPRLTGTFLQAWSNAEELRVWYQWILGVRPNMLGDEVVLAPRLPEALGAVEFTSRVGTGALHGAYSRVDGARRYVWTLRGLAATLVLDLPPYATRAFAASPGDSLIAEERRDGLHVQHVSGSGAVLEAVVLPPLAERRERQARMDAIFAGTGFARPGDADERR